MTIPSQAGFASQTAAIAARWGADAIRNSDGTALDADVLALGKRVYGTYFPARGHNAFMVAHQNQCPQMYLMSQRVCAPPAGPLTIALMEGYSAEQFRLNYDDAPSIWWEVIDRTTGSVVPAAEWRLDEAGVVTIGRPVPYHEYTVSFLAYVIWDPVQMYNHLTNDWGDKSHEIPLDIRHPESWEFVKQEFSRWLAAHPEVDVVRFTTFFYQFALVFDQDNREKFVDWLGYGATVSPAALDAFEREKGYRLRPEDFVDEGYYNSSFHVPSQRYLDYLGFVGDAVAGAAAELVAMAHAAGKQAMMFLGDQWIGTEPYGDRFASIGLDAVVGSVGDGTTLRMIADIENVAYTEGRFLPYFFPDAFHDGADPVAQARANWLGARRAQLRRPLDRMGYGGYLSLASQFPDFVDEVARICDEFRDIHRHVGRSAPWTCARVAVLDAWGTLRSWQGFTVAHALPYPLTRPYAGVLESLSGLPVDVVFVSFDDVLRDGIDPSIDVIVTMGPRDTAFSGGSRWRDERLVTTVRRWVHDGGGLIGVGEPTATVFQGRFFQLADCFGVDREWGPGLSSDKIEAKPAGPHFITADFHDTFEGMNLVTDVFAIGGDTEVLASSRGDVQLAAHRYGRGRAVYSAGLPFSIDNTRLLHRAILWAAHKDAERPAWFSENPACEVNYYPDSGVYCVTNLTGNPQETSVVDGHGSVVPWSLDSEAIVWGEAR